MDLKELPADYFASLVGYKGERPAPLERPYIAPCKATPFPVRNIKPDSFYTVFLEQAGRFSTIDYITPLEGEGYNKGLTVIKYVQGLPVQAGANYSARAATISARAEGRAPAKPHPLPWGEWVSFPYVIEHNGSYYLRFYTYRSTARPRVSYYVEGRQVTWQAAKRIAPKRFKGKPAHAPLSIREDHIMRLG